MSVLARSADRCYPISEVWLATEDDAPAYIDVREIRAGNSAYVNWIIANDPTLIPDNTIEGHKEAINFTLNGIRVGETSRGPEIRGRYAQNAFTTTMKYASGINHPERYSRIYREQTTARHLAFVGYDA